MINDRDAYQEAGWQAVVRNKWLSEETIRVVQDIIDLRDVCCFQLEFQHKVDWDLMCEYQTFTEHFIISNTDKMAWDKVCQY